MNSLGKLPLNWFDLFVVLILVFGAFRGRKRGMSQELLPLLKWITIVLVCGFFYAPIATEVSHSTVFSMLTASFMTYLGLALVVAVVFALLNRQLGGKIIGSDTFGRAEYYLGIFSGMIRFACLLIFGMALLNAPLYTQSWIDDHARYVKKNYDNDFFPAFYQVQAQVFKDSLSGPVITQNLGCVLIKPAASESKPIQRKQLDIPM